MSEGSIRKKDRLEIYLSNEIESPPENQDDVATLSGTDPFSPSPRASTPRAGALLVEAYARVIGKHRSFSPEKVIIEYIRYLVSMIILCLIIFGF